LDFSVIFGPLIGPIIIPIASHINDQKPGLNHLLPTQYCYNRNSSSSLLSSSKHHHGTVQAVSRSFYNHKIGGFSLVVFCFFLSIASIVALTFFAPACCAPAPWWRGGGHLVYAGTKRSKMLPMTAEVQPFYRRLVASFMSANSSNLASALDTLAVLTAAGAAVAAEESQNVGTEETSIIDASHQKVQAVARLHPSWFKGKGAEAELKETALVADPRLVTFKGQKIIFMGYLLKYGKALFKNDWKKRFFVLTPDFLCKFSSRDDYMDGKNADTTIDLHECTVVTAEQETSQPFSFKITCPRFKASESTSVMPGFVLLAAENAWELGAFHPVSFLSYSFH
jgi:hypothetical protein